MGPPGANTAKGIILIAILSHKLSVWNKVYGERMPHVIEHQTDLIPNG
jgi:hypothetical protein